MLTPNSPGVSAASTPPSSKAGPGQVARGLGSVATMAAGVSSTPARGTSAAPADGSARRSVRNLPDLGSVAPTSLAFGPSGTTPARPASDRPSTGLPSASPGIAPTPPTGAGLPRSSASPGMSVPAPATPARDAPVAPPAVVPADPGERFERVLGDHRGPAPERLPRRFAPMAKALVARPDRVRVSTGDASRKALASVGKKAATAGDVVHLARPLDSRPESVDILAHELTHVAHPSPLVRFFDDDRSSKEEALAREVGEIMAKAPVGSPPATPSPLQGGGSAGGQGATPAGGSGGAQGLSRGSAGQGAAGNGQGVGSGFGQGQGAGGGFAQGGSPAGAPPGLLPPVAGQGWTAPGGSGQGAGAGLAGIIPSAAGAAPATTIDIDRLLDALEARVLRELERRGRRWPRPM